MVNVLRAMTLWREKYEKSSRYEQFWLLAYLYLDAPYVWGKEVPGETDCSGLVCGIFTFMGNPIRVTATSLMNDVFLTETDGIYEEGTIKAGFLVANNDYHTPSGKRPAGTARHVGLLYGENLFLHASFPRGTAVEELEKVRRRYEEMDCSMIFKELDWCALKKMEGQTYGLDEDLI